jgi:hypothetical protein
MSIRKVEQQRDRERVPNAPNTLGRLDPLDPADPDPLDPASRASPDRGNPPKRPLLLVDVDGVISLFGFDPERCPSGHWQMVDGIAHFLSGAAGDHLRRLSMTYELVWCTGWEEKANEYLPLALGLDQPLPHLSFADAIPQVEGHWKLRAIDHYAGADRPVAWIDDAHEERCRSWAQERSGPTLLITTDPATGLTGAHVGRLLDWASALRRDHREDRRQPQGDGRPGRPRVA